MTGRIRAGEYPQTAAMCTHTSSADVAADHTDVQIDTVIA
jgi:hypothetical protein